jgi:Acetyl xylan esterase (AXE1)
MPARRLLPLLIVVFAAPAAVADDRTRIFSADEKPADRRLGKLIDLNKDYFPFTPPTNKHAWEERRVALRRQIQVAEGLWPMPERGPVKATVHGAINRDGYTVEKVFFASLPGHYVTGNLYRPTVKAPEKRPVVLCPHGHWADGRMHDAGEKAAKKELETGAESWNDSARYFLQAKCAQLARMGCVVFHYDMVGYADSTALVHRQGFTDPEAVLWGQSQMGLQTWNSLRALDFVCGLPDVDPSRIGVTGASGGGTQTFILAALDDRVTAAFPAVMVSTAMQGGCVCENAPYLRLGTGNVEIAGLFAPKPLGMSGANDWTKDIESKGLPELKALYRLYDAEENVLARCFPQFGHNYNQVSREVMYNWFNSHLKLGLPTPVKEQPFEPIPPKELSVYDEQHPRPKDDVGADGVKKYLTEQSRAALQALEPKSAKQLASLRHVVGTALQVMVNDTLPPVDAVEAKEAGDREEFDGYVARKFLLGRKGQHEQVPAYGLGRGAEFNGTVVIWVHPAGKASLFADGKLSPAAKSVLDTKAAILAVDVCGTGELGGATRADGKYPGFTIGYNRPLLGERVHDILTAIAFAKAHPQSKEVRLVGWESAGPWVVLARALAWDAVARTAADLNGFRFENVRTNDDPMMLPGALQYGGMAAFASLCAPSALLLHNRSGSGTRDWVWSAYQAAGAEVRFRRETERLDADKVVEWLLADNK